MLIAVPMRKPLVATHRMRQGFLTPAQCKELTDYCVENDKFEMIDVPKDLKKIELAEIEPGETKLINSIYSRITRLVPSMNPWGVRLQNISRPMQVLRYRPGYNMRMHVDFVANRGEYDKLAFLSLLTPPSSFSGGRLVMNYNPVKNFRQGSLCSFPGYVMHNVEPVTRGVRMTLVCWVSGPAFV